MVGETATIRSEVSRKSREDRIYKGVAKDEVANLT
jgi:hypothetical protein